MKGLTSRPQAAPPPTQTPRASSGPTPAPSLERTLQTRLRSSQRWRQGGRFRARTTAPPASKFPLVAAAAGFDLALQAVTGPDGRRVEPPTGLGRVGQASHTRHHSSAVSHTLWQMISVAARESR